MTLTYVIKKNGDIADKLRENPLSQSIIEHIVSGNAWVDPELKEAIELTYKIKIRELGPIERKKFERIKYNGQQKLINDESQHLQAKIEECALPEVIIFYKER